ncbi:MAG: PAS domain S-box protein [Acidobacteria bacterium]|nr:PAS domain S-box protein [Acidobacteriota bacterium]
MYRPHEKVTRILLIDEHQTARELVKKQFASACVACEWTEADSLKQIEAARIQQIQLILTEVSFQSLTWAAVQTTLETWFPYQPIIVVTSPEFEDMALQATTGLASDYVLKCALRRLPLAARRALKALTTSMEIPLVQYRYLFNHNPQPMWVYDLKTLKFLDVNESALRVYGYTREEFHQMTILDIRPPEDIDAVKNSVASLPEGLGVPKVWHHLTKDRRLIEVEILSYGLEFHGAEARLVLVTDITARRQAEAKLQQSEARFSKFFHSNPIGCFITTYPEGRILDANPQILSMVGFEREEVLNQTTLDLNLWVVPGTRHHLIQQFADHQTSAHVEAQIRTKTGEIKDTLTSVELIEIDEQPAMLCMLHDITELKQGQIDLIESERHLAEAQRLAKLGNWSREIETGKLTWSKELYHIFEINEQTFPATFEAFLALVHSDDRDRVIACLSEALNSGNPFEHTYRILTSDGKTKVMLEHGEAERDEFGEVCRLYGYTQDITERARAEADNQELTTRLTHTLDTISEGFYTLDQELRLTYVNREFERITHTSRHQIIGRKILELFPEIESVGLLAVYQQVLETGTHQMLELYYPPLDVWVALRVYAVDEGLGVYFWDITEKRKAEAVVKQIEEQLRQSQKMQAVGQLAGGIAHDFNNLLTAITGYTALTLHHLHPADPLCKNLNEIAKAADRAAGLTRQLLTFSRKQVMQFSVINLNSVVADMERMFHRIIGEHIALKTKLISDLWPVKADQHQIEQVLMNLVVNARDAMLEGGNLTIETANVFLDPAYTNQHFNVNPGEYVLMAVSDTGCGMDAETKSRVFEPFFTTKSRDKGTGLGLPTVYGIITQSNGYIWIYSELGVGTTFKIYLPRTHEVDQPVEIHQHRPVLPAQTATILLVEDEAVVRNLTRQILKDAGFQVYDAGSAEAALELIETQAIQFDFLLTDVVLPGIKGPLLAKQLKEKQPDLPVLYISGYTENAIAHHGVVDEGVELLQKPFTPKALIQRVLAIMTKVTQ